MRNGICTKCKSQNIYVGSKVKIKGGAYGSNSIPITALSIAPLDNYVCVDCGYVESYVTDAEKLKKIADKWPKVKNIL